MSDNYHKRTTHFGNSSVYQHAQQQTRGAGIHMQNMDHSVRSEIFSGQSIYYLQSTCNAEGRGSVFLEMPISVHNTSKTFVLIVY